MKIAVVAPTELPSRRANTLQVMKMAQALAALRHQVRLVAPRSSSQVNSTSAADEWQNLARHYGLQHNFPVDWLPAKPRWRRYDYSLRSVRWARRWQADLLYTRLPQAAAIASTLGMPTIFEVHDLPQGMVGPWLLRRFLAGLGAARLVVITKALADDLHSRFSAPVLPPFTVIAPDGVDLERYENLPEPAQARRELKQRAAAQFINVLEESRFTAGYTGHLYPGRGSHLLLELATRLPETMFLLVGGEPQEVENLRIEANVRQLSNFILTGFVPNAELPLYQAACDVLLMPYQQHVAASSGGDIARYLSPMKLFEYLACKRAILSSDLPVFREVLTLQNALLLPSDDTDAWTTALQSLKANPDLSARLATQARTDATQYTWERRAARILEGIDPHKHLKLA